MRLVFAGTPEPALPALRRLIESPRHDVIAVLSRPDAVSGRRGKPAPSPVAALAAEHGIPVLKPSRPNSAEFVAELAELAPDCCAVVAYGALLSAGAARGAHPRLGQPALLTAAGLAGRRAGPGRDRGRRHRDRGDHLPHRTGTGLRAGVRRRHRNHRAHRHRRGSAWPPCGFGCRPAGGDDRRHRRRRRWRPSRNRRTESAWHPRSPSSRRGSDGTCPRMPSTG